MVSIYEEVVLKLHFEEYSVVKSQLSPESSVDVTQLVECLPMYQEFPGFDPRPPAPQDSSCGCSYLLSKHNSGGGRSSKSSSGVVRATRVSGIPTQNN